MKKKNFLFLAFLALIFVACSNDSDNGNNQNDQPVRIGIAWRADVTSEFYTNVVRALKEAGAEPVLLPQVKFGEFASEDETLLRLYINENDYLLQQYADMIKTDPLASNAADAIKDVKAVVFTGGEDIAPSLLSIPEPWHGIEAEKDYNAMRDISDYLTMTYCLDHDIPVLGMCRGMQMLVVVSGGTIIQDIPNYFELQGKSYHNEHRNMVAPGQYRDYASHDVDVLDHSSWLYRITGSDVIHGVPSWHHQCVGSVEGTPLRVSGCTMTEGINIIEAVERIDKTFAIGLQYHPEAAVVKCLDGAANASQFMSYNEGLIYFKALVNQAKQLPRQ